MSSDYNFVLPWAPSVNSCWMVARNRIIISKRGRAYRSAAIECMKLIGLHGEHITSNVSVDIILNPPTLRRYDVDNFTKSLFDALTHADFWVDDEQVQDMRVIKGVKTKGGSVEVSVNLL